MKKSRESFLVRIFADDSTIVGVGFLVSDRHVISCAHVVAKAIPNCEDTNLSEPTGTLAIDFPFVAENTKLQARVCHWLPVKSKEGQQPRGDEDIAILEIQGILNGEHQAADLLPLKSYLNLKFESFGFPYDSDNVQLVNGMPIDGMTGREIIGGCIKIKNLNSNSSDYFIKEGFSGAPIWDNESVIGMVVSAEDAPAVAYMLPSNLLMIECFEHIARLTPGSSKELVGLLKDISSRSWHSIYSMYSVDKASRLPANIYLAVLDLLRLTDRQKGLDFISHLGQEFQCQSLVEWLKNHFPKYYPQSYNQITYKESETTVKGKLLFQVEPYISSEGVTSEESFELHYWFNDGTGYIKDSDIEPKPQKLHEIFEIIQETVNEYCVDDYVNVELVLPRSKFSLDITKLKTQNGAIFLQYESFVVLRCLDRFNARRKRIERHNRSNPVLRQRKDKLDKNTTKHSGHLRLPFWRSKSSILKEFAKCQAGQFMYALAPDQSLEKLFQEFNPTNNNNKGLFVACSFAPQANQDSSVLSIALDYGAPLAIWFRELPEGIQYDDAKLLEMLGLHAGITLDALPDHIWKLQKKALEEDNRENPLYHLTILYDDYESVPQ